MQAQLRDDAHGVISFVGVGSNMDDPAARCGEALCYLSQVSGIRVLRQSSFYRTEPVGFEKQDWFINAVAEIRTVFTPHELLKATQEIEDKMGRVRGPRWGPRVIDLDILLYGQEVVEDDELVIPHPEFHKRRFILEPLREIASYAIHPVFGVSIRGLMERLDDDSRVYLCRANGEPCLA
ncbi:MAG: 2-amino-4-hydroxy-6-hydroxymethyldihydropteridine diphosphokinase [Syntrophales bacterium]